MKKKILVVDDDPLVLKSVRNLLTREGYEVDCAKSGQEAIAKLETLSFDLIISDIRMPEQDGISVVRRIREICKQKQQADIPCIFITGYASEDAPIDAFRLGAVDYILKPFNIDELLATVKRVIERVQSEALRIEDLLMETKKMLDKYQDGHEKKIFDDQELCCLMNKISSLIFAVEKEILKSKQ